MGGDAFGAALRETLLRPHEGARRVLGWSLAWREIALVVAAGIALALLNGTLFGIAASRVVGVAAETGFGPADIAVQLGEVVIVTALATWVGRAFGGRGSAERVAAAVAWVNLAQNVALLPFAFVTAFVGGGFAILAFVVSLWLVWVLACFIAEAHGFASPGRVLGAMIGVAIVFVLLLILAGYEPPGLP
jgi:hypothetical protein